MGEAETDRNVGLLEDCNGLVGAGRFNEAIAAAAKELHDGHTDQRIAVEDEHRPSGRFTVAVKLVRAKKIARDAHRSVVRLNRTVRSVLRSYLCRTRLPVPPLTAS